MSYDDYRSGRRPQSSVYGGGGGSAGGASAGPTPSSRPPLNLSAYDSFARPPTSTRVPSGGGYGLAGRPSPSNAPSSIFPSSTAGTGSVFASSMGGGRVDNPYATNAYSSSRPAATPSGDIGGVGSGDMTSMPMPMLGVAGKSKSAANVKGKLNDTIKNTMAAAKQDNWKVVCVKATNHDLAAPKGKHVRVIMQGLQWGGSLTNRESPAGGIYYHLRKRLMLNQSVVALKSLTIFHHIFRDGNDKFVDYVAANQRTIFRMDFFGDPSPEAMIYTPFIRTYGAYIEQWCAMRAAINFPPGKSKEGDTSITSRYRTSNIESLFGSLPVIMDTLTTMFALEINGQIRYSPVAAPAFSMIFRDLTILWVALSEGMIRMLDLFFNLDQEHARIGVDVYKRFVELSNQARPFFETARSINSRWQVPELGAISMELLDSMQKYADMGPEEPKYDDEERYDDEPEPEPEPEPYYEPEPEYYSEEEPEPVVRRLPTPPPLSSSSESEIEESESESESEEESEEEPDVLPSAPEPPPAPAPPKAFDPLADLLGITSGIGENGHQNGGMYATSNPQQTMALQLYGAGGPAMLQRATLEQTADERVANVKGMMAVNGGAQQNQRNGFGVDGANMQIAMYGPQQIAQMQMQQQQQQQQQQQMYNSMAMQQQMAAYQTMAAYQSMASGYNPQQMAMLQQQQMMQQQMMRQQQMQMGGGRMGGGMRPGGGGGGGGTAGVGVPAMQADRVDAPAVDYKVQRGTKPTRVNTDDQAFGPLIEEMKRTNIGPK